jgi:hypothetical protein
MAGYAAMVFELCTSVHVAMPYRVCPSITDAILIRADTGEDPLSLGASHRRTATDVPQAPANTCCQSLLFAAARSRPAINGCGASGVLDVCGTNKVATKLNGMYPRPLSEFK